MSRPDRSKPDLWLPLVLLQWHRDTRPLSRAARGDYVELVVALWEHGGTLPNDDETLARTVGATPDEWQQTKRVLLALGLFEDLGTRIAHPTLTRERERAEGLCQKRSKAGVVANDHRWHKRPDDDGDPFEESSESDPNRIRIRSESDPSLDPNRIHNNNNNDKKNNTPGGSPSPPEPPTRANSSHDSENSSEEEEPAIRRKKGATNAPAKSATAAKRRAAYEARLAARAAGKESLAGS